jgi:hypothetical protein
MTKPKGDPPEPDWRGREMAPSQCNSLVSLVGSWATNTGSEMSAAMAWITEIGGEPWSLAGLTVRSKAPPT